MYYITTYFFRKMDYMDIPVHERQYIRKLTYNKMNDTQKEMYVKSITDLLISFSALRVDTTRNKSKQKRVKDKIPRRRIKFTGMKYRYNHVFTDSDRVKLKDGDDDVIKVLVKEDKKWKHVAYVSTDDVEWLRSVEDFEHKPLEWINVDKTYAIYDIILLPSTCCSISNIRI
ncbi:hypothetical protein MVEG_12440 [Podila verticillata NRRL 6337]|uniref:Uncharacterized protein n=1 Tax=Podila verticillata NRRL 6337 TaxID=1069443 RepID=A0A086TIE7_9FUNG|nr:hypothetical protein MVEG_12440 [Podila verticillata NRRL 6337]